MKLVRLENYRIVVEPELLLLKPFELIYQADKTRDKTHFYEFLTILYFTYDPRSDYQYIIDEESRLEEVCKSNGIKLRKFTKEELKCVELYKQLTTTMSLELLKSLKIAINAIQEEFNTTRDTLRDLESKDKVNAIKSLTGTLATIPNLIKQLTETEKLVSKEIEETTRKRGGEKGSSVFEEGGF